MKKNQQIIQQRQPPGAKEKRVRVLHTNLVVLAVNCPLLLLNKNNLTKMWITIKILIQFVRNANNETVQLEEKGRKMTDWAVNSVKYGFMLNVQTFLSKIYTVTRRYVWNVMLSLNLIARMPLLKCVCLCRKNFAREKDQIILAATQLVMNRLKATYSRVPKNCKQVSENE